MSESVLDLVKRALYYGEAPPRLSRAAEDAVSGVVAALAAAEAERDALEQELARKNTINRLAEQLASSITPTVIVPTVAQSCAIVARYADRLSSDPVSCELYSGLVGDDTANARMSDVLRVLLDALATSRAENAKLREAVKRMADGDWIIASWLNEAGDFVWRVNVRDEPSKKKGTRTYTGTQFTGATPVDAALAALGAHLEETR